MAALRTEYARRSLRILRAIQLASSPPQHPQSDFVDPSVLACHPIRLSSLVDVWDEKIDFEPRFSCLYNSHHFEEVFQKTIGPPGKEDLRGLPTTENPYTAGEWMQFVGHILRSRELEDTDWFDPQTKRLLEHSQWNENPRLARGAWSGFLETQGEENDSWATHEIFAISEQTKPAKDDSYDEELPHISCLLEDPAVMDDRATRSEILCATLFMMQRLRYRAWNGHCVHPVFIYRFNNAYAKITQAHFDGSYLQLRQSRPIALITDDRVATLKLLLRWIMADPLHNTKCGEAPMPEFDVNRDQVQAPPSPERPRMCV